VTDGHTLILTRLSKITLLICFFITGATQGLIASECCYLVVVCSMTYPVLNRFFSLSAYLLNTTFCTKLRTWQSGNHENEWEYHMLWGRITHFLPHLVLFVVYLVAISWMNTCHYIFFFFFFFFFKRRCNPCGFWPAQQSLSILSRKVLQSAVASSTSNPPTWRTSDYNVPTLATRRLKRRERTPAAEGGTMGEKLPRILPNVATSTSVLGSFTCRKFTTWPGLNPWTWVPKASTLTSMPPKPLYT